MRRVMLKISESDRLKHLVSTLPVSSGIVARFVAGETAEDAVRATRELGPTGCTSRLDHLGEDTARPGATPRPPATPTSCCSSCSHDGGLTARCRGVGEALRGRAGAARRRREDRAGQRARHLRGGPRRRHHGHPRHGGPHHHRLDAGHPARAARRLPRDRRGAAGLPAPHRGRLPRPRRTRARGCGCARAPTRSRSRWPSRASTDVDLSYVRCLKVLMAGEGYPMIATHDPRLIAIAGTLACRTAASRARYEYQMLYGIRPRRAAPAGGAGREGARLRARTARTGTATSSAGWPSGPPTSRSSCARCATQGRERRRDAAGRRARRRQDGRGAALRHAARGTAGRRPASSPPAGRSAPSCCASATACEVVEQRRGGQGCRHPDPHGQAAGHGRRCWTSSAPHVPADRLVVSVAAGITTAFIERRLRRRASPVVRVMSNTPVLVDEAMSAISAGAHATEEHLRRTEELFAPVGKHDPGARVAAGRGHRAVRQRAGVLLLPGRGDDRRRHPARPAAQVAHDLIVQTAIGAAVMLRDSGEHPVEPARGGHLAGRHHDQRDPRAGEPRRAGRAAGRARGRPRPRPRAGQRPRAEHAHGSDMLRLPSSDARRQTCASVEQH